MKNIKGPKSALTDFIEEHGIKIQHKKEISGAINDIKEITKKKRTKRIKICKPLETVNRPDSVLEEEEKRMVSMLSNIENHQFDDESLRKIAIYLSKNRLMNQFYFQFLIERSKDKLSIFDCANIPDSSFLNFKDLKTLELFQCGQLTETTLNAILSNMERLTVLRITGAYLIENFEIPKTLNILDLTNCSRLSDDFICNLNESLTSLDELRLSFCYGLSSMAQLSLSIKHLFICETKLSENFLQNFEDLTSLSVSMCPNINDLPTFRCIKHLDVGGITTLENIKLPETIESLNISYISSFGKFDYPNLKYLNLSHSNLDKDDFFKIYSCKALKHLNISWNQIVDDDIFQGLLTDLNLEKLEVFGCFGLTKASAALAYSIKDRCEVVGNPSETIYLLDADL